MAQLQTSSDAIQPHQTGYGRGRRDRIFVTTRVERELFRGNKSLLIVIDVEFLLILVMHPIAVIQSERRHFKFGRGDRLI